MGKFKFYDKTNGQIYDLDNHRRVTMKELAKRIAEGEKVKVVNHAGVDCSQEIFEKVTKLVPENLDSTILIKKYQNRKLYNMNSQKYISLQEVYQMFSKKENVKIVTQVGSEDITDKVKLTAMVKFAPQKLLKGLK